MNNKTKVFGLIIILAILLSIIFIGKKGSTEYSPEEISQFLIDNDFIGLDDIDNQVPVVITKVEVGKNGSVTFLEIPEWSGTGGSRGVIVSSDGKGDLSIIGEFFGSASRIKDSIETRGPIVTYNELYKLGSCCYSSTEVHLNLDDPSKNLKPSINESLKNYSWVNDNTITIERHISDSLGNQYPREVWGYDTLTNKYTLIE